MNSTTFLAPDAESELLLRCCTVSGLFADSRAMLELAARRVDWSRFLALANRNSITAMVGVVSAPIRSRRIWTMPAFQFCSSRAAAAMFETPEKIVSYRQ
jgi:hypothetical protein